MASKYDVIIIGTGAGGGTLASKLAPTGKKILLLERGGYVPREKENWNSDLVNHGRYQTKEHWKDKDGKEAWRDAAGKTADKAKVEDLLTKLSNIRATAFREAADRSLSTPTLSVTITMDGGRKESVGFARQTDTVFARRADEPGMATLEVVALNDALTALDALK